MVAFAFSLVTLSHSVTKLKTATRNCVAVFYDTPS